MIELAKLDFDVYEQRPLQRYQYTYYVTLPSDFCRKNRLAKGTHMVILAQNGVLIILSKALYRKSIRVQRKIQEFFFERDVV